MRRTFTVLASAFATADLLDLLATLGGDPARRGPRLQALDRRAHQVDRVTRTDGLADDVLHTRRFEHGAHRAAGDHAGTFRSGLHVDASRTMVGLDRVPDGTVVQFDVDQRLARVFHRLLDCDRPFTRLAVSE